MASEALRMVGKFLFKYRFPIMTGAGLVSMSAGTALACYKMKKVIPIMDAANTDLANIKKAQMEYAEDPDSFEEAYTEQDAKDDKKKVVLGTFAAVAKEMILPAGLEVVGASLIVGSCVGQHNDIQKKAATIAGVTALYTAADTAYRRLRDNTIEALGEQAAAELRYGLEEKEVEVPWDPNDDGYDPDEEPKTETKLVVKTPADSALVKTFCRQYNGSNWRPDRTMNINFLKTQIRWCEDIAVSQHGWISANQMLEALSFDTEIALEGFGVILEEGQEHLDFVLFEPEDSDGAIIVEFPQLTRLNNI